MFMLDMGMMKTSTTLTVIKHCLYNFDVLKPLIIGPKFVVADTWPSELAKWDHIKHLTISLIIGTEEQRIAAVKRNTDIYAVSRDNIDWLTRYLGKKWDFDMLVIDESSNFKNASSKRYRAVQRILPKISRLLLLTGTPIPNGLIDLWAQMKMIDGGKRLKIFKKNFIAEYYRATKMLSHGAMQYELKNDSSERIYEAIKDRCISMKSVDYIELPGRTDIIREVYLDPEEMDAYRKFKRDKTVQVVGTHWDGEPAINEITAFNASSLYGKLLQFANGAIYDEEKNWHLVHDKKLDVLEEVIEELQGQNVIVCYQFKSDLERIKKRFPQAVHVNTDEKIKAWKRAEINFMLCHAASLGYGLNLQTGGHNMVWFGLTNDAEIFWQMLKRLDRTGQEFPVNNILILVKGTSEYKVHRSILNKTYNQDMLFEALK